MPDVLVGPERPGPLCRRILYHLMPERLLGKLRVMEPDPGTINSGKCDRRLIPPARKLIQAAWTLFSLYTGWQFYRFYSWALHYTDYTPRPPAVEAFLPIDALMSLKRLIMTGSWDPIHPAGLAFFIAVLAGAFFFRRGFCGWVCPVGLLSDITWKAGQAMKISFTAPAWLRYPLLSIKYILLGFFVWIILFRMDNASISSFMQSPYNITVDARMLEFFLHPSPVSTLAVVALVLLSFTTRHLWCTYLCPYGALLGLIAACSPLHVRRNPGLCLECRKCETACPASIRIWKKQNVRAPECIGCLECLAACPETGCLDTAAAGQTVPCWAMPAGVTAIIIAVWLAALLTGHWHTTLPDNVFRLYYLGFLAG